MLLDASFETCAMIANSNSGSTGCFLVTWDAFWRTAVLGQATADVADELGMTAAAVRKAKSRTLQRLRRQLGDIV
ncbi:MAG: hypothetical protein R3E01_22750 [Pirellulaceae bacterium]